MPWKAGEFRALGLCGELRNSGKYRGFPALRSFVAVLAPSSLKWHFKSFVFCEECLNGFISG